MEEIEDIIASVEDDGSDFFEDEDPHEASWIAEDKNTAVKKTDRHVFLYRETVIPEKMRAFFSLAGLQPGKKKKIALWQQNNRFDAFIEKTLHDPPLTRLRWGKEFASLLTRAFPEWSDFFKKSREESVDTPSLWITKRQTPDEYEIAFEGAPQGAAATGSELPIKPGDITDNDNLVAVFRCSSQGAMRRSLKTNSLILISDHTKPVCEDKWIGRTFHYSGMGLTGAQGLSFNQNKALAESGEKGTGLFLFEVFTEGDYTYTGEVELADNPYLSRQTDPEKVTRDVTVFPLQLKGGGHPPLPPKDVPETREETARKKAQKLPMDQLEFAARYSLKKGGRREVVSEVFDGDQIVSEYAKRRADGTCQLCNGPAPFSTRDGDPFLEVHHIVPLKDGGQDTVDNVVALCPNCHRRMHVLNQPADVAALRKKVSVRD